MKMTTQQNKRIEITSPLAQLKIDKMACLFFFLGIVIAASIWHGFAI